MIVLVVCAVCVLFVQHPQTRAAGDAGADCEVACGEARTQLEEKKEESEPIRQDVKCNACCFVLG